MCFYCLPPKGKKRQDEIQLAGIKAKNSAINERKNFIVYERPDGHIGYTSEDLADQLGYEPLKTITYHR